MDIPLPELFRMEMEQLAQETLKDPDDVIWRFSPLDIREFDIMLHIAYDLAIDNTISPAQQISHPSIVEAGSGIGTKLYLAKNKYMMIEYGYEINPEYVAKARELGVKCEVRDLTQDPAPVWGMYDIVYTCRPLKNDIAEHRWERSVQEAMRPGAVLMAAFVAAKPYNWPCYYRRPFRGIWVKPEPNDEHTQAEARMAVVQRAQELAGMPT
jgi:hypothetical protein